MRLRFHEAAGEELCPLPIKHGFFSYGFLRPPIGRSTKHARKAVYRQENRRFFRFYMELQPFLSILGRYKSHRISAGPFAAWYNWKESHPGQFYLLYRAALFVCPGSDTFLMNYTMWLNNSTSRGVSAPTELIIKGLCAILGQFFQINNSDYLKKARKYGQITG